jgi:hypothetical protein
MIKKSAVCVIWGAALLSLPGCGGEDAPASSPIASPGPIVGTPTPSPSPSPSPSTSLLAASDQFQSITAHPRIHLTSAVIDRLKDARNKSGIHGDAVNRLVTSATNSLTTKPPVYDASFDADDPLYGSSRNVIQNNALAYHLTGDSRYSRRAIDELLALSRYPTWIPLDARGVPSSDVLRAGVAVRSIAIGYDWLYSAMTVSEREIVRHAIQKNFLEPVVQAVKAEKAQLGKSGNHGHFATAGLIMSALALYGEDPALDGELLANFDVAIANLRDVQLGKYEGAFAEGPNYLAWGQNAAMSVIPAIITAFGSGRDLPSLEALHQSGLFHVYLRGPSGWDFSFADSVNRTSSTATHMLWLASLSRKPAFADQFLRSAASSASQTPSLPGNAEAVIFFEATLGAQPAQAPEFPLSFAFPKAGLAFMRSSWTDPNALYVAAKGGTNATGHAHRDLGNFILEAGGQRWFEDLGRDNYGAFPADPTNRLWNTPTKAYRGKAFRVSAAAHNVVIPDLSGDQSPEAEASIRVVRDGLIEISSQSAYPGVVSSWLRQITMNSATSVTVADALVANQPVSYTWSVMTSAQISISGNEAMLMLSKNPSPAARVLSAKILAPANATFAVQSANPGPPNNPNNGMRRLVVLVPASTARTDVRVQFDLLGS